MIYTLARNSFGILFELKPRKRCFSNLVTCSTTMIPLGIDDYVGRKSFSTKDNNI